jgi:hypothetical protein
MLEGCGSIKLSVSEWAHRASLSCLKIMPNCLSYTRAYGLETKQLPGIVQRRLHGAEWNENVTVLLTPTVVCLASYTVAVTSLHFDDLYHYLCT